MAVSGFAPVALTLGLLLAALGVTPAGADQGPTQATAALTAKVGRAAVRIHQLTEQLDQARLQVNATSARLVNVTQQDQATVQKIGANRAVLLNQAVRAYMNGGMAPSMSSSQSANLAVSREYLTVASGDLSTAGEQLRQMDDTLRGDQVTLRSARQDKTKATVQLETLRSNAVAIAASEQGQLDVLQAQLAAQAAVAAQTQAQAARTVTQTQGVPVNNGLVAVVQQAAGLPVVAPVVAVATTVVGAVDGSGGGHAGGIWLQLRMCESSDNYAENTGNGFYGAYQFSASTWSGLGYPGRPDQESPGMQDAAAMKLQGESGWGQWPACSAALGLS